MRKNGGTALATATSVTSLAARSVGARLGSTPFGAVYEFMTFTNLLSNANRRLIEANQGSFYGITVS